jgi:hypothetical protein
MNQYYDEWFTPITVGRSRQKQLKVCFPLSSGLSLNYELTFGALEERNSPQEITMTFRVILEASFTEYNG